MQGVLSVCVLALVVANSPGPSGYAADDEPTTSSLLVEGSKPAPPFVMVDESSGQPPSLCTRCSERIGLMEAATVCRMTTVM